MWASLIDKMRGVKSFPRGIHPPHRKGHTESEPIRLLAPGTTLQIPLAQHIGKACAPLLKPRSEVVFAQRIAEADAFVSSPIHASANGATAAGSIVALPSGRRVPAIPLKVSEPSLPEGFFEEYLRRDWDSVEPASYEPEAIVHAIRDGGIVGLGGATFPTHVKLTRNPERPIDTLVLNGCECEPYLTADHRLMLETPEAIVTGLHLAMHAAGVSRALIAIEDNKPDAIATMQKAAADRPGIEVVTCATKYPMGGERQLIYAVLGRVVPSAPKGLPLDVGVVVINVATAHSIARAVVHGQPLTHRVVTVTGLGIRRPANWLAPIGMSFRELIEASGGAVEGQLKIVAGGPMMGPTAPSPDTPVVKGTGGIVVMAADEAAPRRETGCIRCGQCIDYCPLYLSPTKIAHAVKFRAYDEANAYSMNACCECGCCSFVCPAHIPLAQYIRAGKYQQRLMAAQAS